MPPTAIVTDSSSCLPAQLAGELGVITVPLGLLIGDEVYADGALSSAELFRLVDQTKKRPRTTSPSPAEFLAAFRKAQDAGASEVLCLTLSSRFSGTYEAAVSARGLAQAKIPGLTIHVADTGALAMAHGFAVLAAARAVAGGARSDAAERLALRTGAEAKLAGLLGTMRYLARGGRVPWIVHWAAQALRIQPLLAFEEGRARSIGRVRTEEKGLTRLLDYARKHAGGHPVRAAVMHTEAPEAAERLAGRLCKELVPVELIATDFTSAMAVHAGPGFVGVAICGAGDSREEG